jgi:glycosyltransferase involved in cell wall biosynthesis
MVQKNNMTLAIDGVGAKHGGAAAVLLATLRAAMRSNRFARVVAYLSPRALRRFDIPVDERIVAVEVASGESGPLSRILWQERGLRQALRRDGVQAAICLGGGGRAWRDVVLCNLVQQSLPFVPEALARLPLRSRLRMIAFKYLLGRSCRAADLVVVQTQTMATSVADQCEVPTAKILVLEPVPDLIAPTSDATILAAMYKTPRDARLLYVGNDSPYKNLGVLGDALRLLREELPDVRLFATLPATHPLAKNPGVIALGYLDANVVAEAYQVATVLVMPSLAETVGFPLLEAAAAGTAVAAADRPYARDVCGGSAVYFDPLQSRDLARILRSLLKDPVLRSEMSEQGRDMIERRRAAKPYDRIVEWLADQVETRLS